MTSIRILPDSRPIPWSRVTNSSGAGLCSDWSNSESQTLSHEFLPGQMASDRRCLNWLYRGKARKLLVALQEGMARMIRLACWKNSSKSSLLRFLTVPFPSHLSRADVIINNFSAKKASFAHNRKRWKTLFAKTQSIRYSNWEYGEASESEHLY